MTDINSLNELKNDAETKRDKLFNFLLGNNFSLNNSSLLPLTFDMNKYNVIDSSSILETEYPVVNRTIKRPSRLIIEGYISIILFTFVKYFLNKLYKRLLSKFLYSSKISTYIKKLYN